MSAASRHASLKASLGLFAGFLLAAGTGMVHAEKKETKNVTFIHAETSADGSSEMRREVLEDCILSLPNPDSLEPQISSEAVYLREINGEKDRNDWAKSYTAKLEVNYLTSEKELLVITTRTVQEQKPIIKQVDKTLRHSQTFTSDPTEGATVAGQSNRQSYFTTADEARKDVRQRARVWIQQQKPVLCRSK